MVGASMWGSNALVGWRRGGTRNGPAAGAAVDACANTARGTVATAVIPAAALKKRRRDSDDIACLRGVWLPRSHDRSGRARRFNLNSSSKLCALMSNAGVYVALRSNKKGG